MVRRPGEAARRTGQECDVPAHFKEDRPEILAEAIRRAGLATLVTLGADGLVASHVPLLLDPEPGAARHAARPHRARQPAMARSGAGRGGAGDLHRAGRLHHAVLVSRQAGAWPRGADLELRRGPRLRAGDVLRRSRPAARHRPPPDRAGGGAPRRALGGVRRAGGVRRGDAEGDRRLRACRSRGSRASGR